MKASNFHCRSMIVKLLAGSALTLFAGALRAEEPSQHGVPRDQKMIDQKLIDDTRKNSDQAVRDREEAVKQAARDKREQELADYRQAERLRQIERIRQEEIRQKAIDDARRDNQRKSENVDHNK